MPRPAQGPHLWYRKPRFAKDGKLISSGQWYIIDGAKHVGTGCAKDEETAADQQLTRYKLEKFQPPRRERDIEAIDVAEVLAIYDADKRDEQVNKRTYDARILRLNEWWGKKKLSDVNGKTCREYVAYRGNAGGARRDLEDLRAAINYHEKEGLHRVRVRVALPPKGQPRDRWLTRKEAAKLVWACWRYREAQRRHRGPDKGKTLPTNKRPLQHVARFILLALYTGTRAGAVAAASPYRKEGRSWVDLDAGLFYRLAEGKKVTNKRQPTVKIPPHLLAHMRRWKERAIAASHFVEHNGEPVTSVTKGFAHAVELAGLEGKVTPHTLRHTAATWLMQHGVPIWEAAGFLGMSEKVLRDTYGHHHPDYQQAALSGFRPKRTSNASSKDKQPKSGTKANEEAPVETESP
jgi:integrase